MKRVVVFGSTKDEIHIGCKTLSSGLEKLIRDELKEKVDIQHISHRFISQEFYNALIKPSFKKSKRIGLILGSTRENIAFEIDRSFNTWVEAFERMLNKDIFLNLTIKNADHIVVNVEGTIHHKAFLGHQMLAIGKMAATLGKEVFWTNFSVEDENIQILKNALQGSKSIAAREQNSYNYLKGLGVDVVQSFDSALLADYENNPADSKTNSQDVVFTGSNIKSYNLVDIAKSISSYGFKPKYIPMGLNDYEELSQLRKAGIDCYEYNNLNFSSLIKELYKSRFVLSGRHHLNVFCLIANKSFIPLKSNTWKIDGVCKMVGMKSNLDDNIDSRIKNMINGADKKIISVEKVTELRKLATLNFKI